MDGDESDYHYDGMADGDDATADSLSSSSSAASSSSTSSSAFSLHNPSSFSSSLSSFAADRPAPRSILKRATGRKRSLRWDESNLAVNESEKVPRMKVDEPKTPYHAHSHSHSSSVGSSSGLSSAGSTTGSFSSGSSSTSEMTHRSAFDQHTVDAVSQQTQTHTATTAAEAAHQACEHTVG